MWGEEAQAVGRDYGLQVYGSQRDTQVQRSEAGCCFTLLMVLNSSGVRRHVESLDSWGNQALL